MATTDPTNFNDPEWQARTRKAFRDHRAVSEELDELMWERRGLVMCCRMCGVVREGTAAFARSHAATCLPARLYAASLLIVHEREELAEELDQLSNISELGAIFLDSVANELITDEKKADETRFAAWVIAVGTMNARAVLPRK